MGILRLLLALSVLASHLGPIMGLDMIGGALAVQTFFIISGFYMSMILNEKYTGVNNSFKLFITNRLLKLYPLYALILFFSFATCLLIGFADKNNNFPVFNTYYAANTSFVSYLFLCFTHLFIIGQDLVMFLGINPDSGNLFFTRNFWNTSPPLYSFLFIQQAWSLALELAFYFVASTILRRSISWIYVLLSLSFLLRMLIYYIWGLQNDPWTYRFFPTEILFFLLGNLSYRVYSKFKKRNLGQLYGQSLCIVIVMFTLFYPLIPSTEQILFQYRAKDLIYLGIMVFSIPFLFIAFKKSSLDSRLGELSYPIYISHLLVARICYLSHWDWPHTPLFIALATIIFSVILNKLIAKPIEKFRQKRLINRDQNESDVDKIPAFAEKIESTALESGIKAGFGPDN